ncbi:MAG: HlyC/CorC family transporter [Lachnospiraceae bacterium]|nr:HlyC/CorC family transporter [Lachnospiraceae bacterium]
MDPDSRSYLILIAFMFLISMFAALAETAIASVNKTRVKVQADRGDKRAKRVLSILEHFDDAITTLLVVTNIAHLTAASASAALTNRLFGIGAITLSTFVMTFLMFFLGEMLPKSIGKKASFACSLGVSFPLFILMKIFWPISKLLSLVAKGASKLFRGEEESTVTEDELYDIIDDMAEEGAIDEDQGELISSALQFGDVTASSILTPRVDVEALDIATDRKEALAFIQKQTHSRLLVYEKSIDHVVGVLQIRKYLKKYIRTGRIPALKPLLDDVYYAYQGTEIRELLQEMSKRKLNMAVITDSYGGTLGIVTVEDIVEEIVGEIWDEDDVIKEPIVELSDNTYLANGDETVLDVFDFIGYEERVDEAEDRFVNLLVSDWVSEALEKIPENGDSFRYDTLNVTVEKVEHNRVLQVRFEVLPEEKEEES